MFSTDKLEWMNGQHLRRLPEGERVDLVRAHLEQQGFDLDGRDPEWLATLVRAIGDRLKTLADAVSYGVFALREELDMEGGAWASLREKPRTPEALAALAARLGSDAEFSLASLERETRGLAGDLGIKAGELIGIARVALAGRKVSPGIFEVMWLLGRDRAVSRLRAAVARWNQESAAGV